MINLCGWELDALILQMAGIPAHVSVDALNKVHFPSKSPDEVGIKLKELLNRMAMVEYSEISEAIPPIVMKDRKNIISEGLDKEYIKDLANLLNRTSNTPPENLKPTIHDFDWDGLSTISFGLIGDTHINNKYTQLTYLHKFYDLCEQREIPNVYLCGDIDDGEHMRRGHEYELYNHGADAHVDEIIRVYPKRTGIETLFITGNHDASMFKSIGFSIGRAIEDKRKDMRFLGSDTAIVNMTPNCSIQLAHPWDGTAYAISYKTQKRVSAMQGGEKPSILAVGHYHKSEYLFLRNVHCFQVGTYCAQTPFMFANSIDAHMGGWIINIKVDENGYIRDINQSFIPEYYGIKDDWKNWR